MVEGHPLIKGVDLGGVRWFLDGKPVHSGYGLEILLVLNPKYTESGALIDFEPVWLPVRLEFEPGKDGRALAYWPTHEALMFSEVREGAQFRWPEGSL